MKKPRLNTIETIATLGVMLALAVSLSALESALRPFLLPFAPPQVKLGLSNIVAMYCVFFTKKSHAVGLNAMKSVFVLLMRGPLAGLLSLSGGMLSIVVIIGLAKLLKDRLSCVTLSVFGGVFHNVGQMLTVSAITGAPLSYGLPPLIFWGAVMGLLTGAVLRATLPSIRRAEGTQKKSPRVRGAKVSPKRGMAKQNKDTARRFYSK